MKLFFLKPDSLQMRFILLCTIWAGSFPAVLVFILLLMTSPLGQSAESEISLDPIFSGASHVKENKRAPASEPFPEELMKEFIVTAPERDPASVKPARKVSGTRSVGKSNVKSHAKSSTPTNSSGRRSRLPNSIVNGFELRILYNNITSMFWVVERNSQYDLVYANSGGSKSSIGMSPENFKQLQLLARGFTPVNTKLELCNGASMQLHVVATGSNERSTTMCANAKGKEADRLRNLSQSLAVLIQ